MTATLPHSRLSPLHDALAHSHPTWGTLGGMPVALHFGTPGNAAMEAKQAATLGLCDVSALPRITLKGPGAKALLEQNHVTVPDGIFAVASSGAGGLSARTGGAEFFVEDGPSDTAVARIRKALAANPTSVYPVHRADAAILLSGTQAVDVLEQTCGVNFRSPEANKLVYTRVAGVACSILPRKLNNIAVFQLWMDGTYGLYLWETLLEIAADSEIAKPQAALGAAVGVSCFFPNLSST